MEEIIPKATTKPLPFLNILLYSLIAIAIGMAAVYVYLIDTEKKAGLVLADIEQILAEEKTHEDQRLESEIFSRRKKIKDFTPLIASHQSAQNFFKLLEAHCHPQVWFSNLSLNLQKYSINLSGSAKDFQTVEQQIFLFQDLNDILEVNLSNISIRKDKGIDFALNITLDPELFKFQINDQ